MDKIPDPATLGLDAVVVPGFPGNYKVTDDEPVVPNNTTDWIKQLRSEGLKVDFPDPKNRPPDLALKSADIIMPILIFTVAALENGAGTILATLILDRIGQGRKGHVEIKVGSYRAPDGEVDWLEAKGSGEDVAKAIRAFRGRKA